jgi:uncharacterized protein (DUF4415 family)
MKKTSAKSGKATSKSQIDKEKDLEKALVEAIAAPMRETKVRVNTWIDGDVYEALNDEAKATGTKYQTLLNKYLRSSVLKEISISDLRALLVAIREISLNEDPEEHLKAAERTLNSMKPKKKAV